MLSTNEHVRDAPNGTRGVSQGVAMGPGWTGWGLLTWPHVHAELNQPGLVKLKLKIELLLVPCMYVSYLVCVRSDIYKIKYKSGSFAVYA